ncbi:MAG TPA: hypothetical protein VMH28_33175 [Candidatus Acidoferrales bacterium]|nr:hypothetical protein [Candidatus Acidoferrales bacterium]
MDLDLDTLKREILEYLESREFAVFRSSPGALEGNQMILWDTEHYPDYQMFLDAATKAGAKLVLFASRAFEAADIDDLLEQLDDVEFDSDDERDYQTRLRKLRAYEGTTCSIELAFNHDALLYVYELQPDWYEEFLSIEDDIAASITDDELDEGNSLGGYFSKN